jgi:orotidine-5'-phosphate decarboxylase
LELYGRVSPCVGYVKVGLSLFVEHGPRAVASFRERGARIFLDLKLHDIPNTVELAAARAAELGVSFLTVHASGGTTMLQAAVRGAKSGAAAHALSPPRVLAVTALTSLSDSDVAAVGWRGTVAEGVKRLAELAQAAGVDGVVCSPGEASALRTALGPGFFLCTPGIRSAADAKGDQTRVENATFALRAGADLLVVGRPIHGAADPVAAAQALRAEIAAT